MNQVFFGSNTMVRIISTTKGILKDREAPKTELWELNDMMGQ
jgi:hypothetical protein